MTERYGDEIILILTKGDVLACADEVGISAEQVTDDVIELVKQKVSLEFRNWPQVIRSALRDAIKCPLGLICYPSCAWWQDDKCIFPGKASSNQS